MDWREHWLQACESIAANPRRALGSGLGVFWGAAATILMLAWGAGFRDFMRTELGRYGRPAVFVLPGVSSSGFPGYRAGVPLRVTGDDARVAERDSAEQVEALVTEYFSRERVRVEARGRVLRLDLTATDARFPELRRFGLMTGRFFDAGEAERARAVVVLGYEAARELFGDPATATGKRIRISGAPFEVIGVFDAKAGRQYINTNRPENRLLVVPAQAAEARLGFRKDRDRHFVLYPRPGQDPGAALSSVLASLARRGGFHPEDADAVRTFDLSRLLVFVDVLHVAFTVFIGLAGTVTLLVGGVGAANYQLALLEERALEIGVAKALGARNSTLMAQVALESLLVAGGAALCGVGVGIALCLGLVQIVPAQVLPAPVISFGAAAITAAALAGVGVVAALVPALRVRGMDTGLALRAGM